MLGFALGNQFLQIAKEEMLLITSYRLTRKKCCKCKETIRVLAWLHFNPWENQHRLQEVTLKICSKHLLLHLRVREFQQEQVSKQPRYNAGLVSQEKPIRGFGILHADTCLWAFQQGWATFAIARQIGSLQRNMPGLCSRSPAEGTGEATTH